MDDDKRKRVKIPIRKKPSIEWLLKNATGSQLDFMRKLTTGTDFRDFINLISKFKEYNVYSVFEYKALDDRDLAVYRSYRKGGVDTLADFILACQMAKEESERRKKVK